MEELRLTAGDTSAVILPAKGGTVKQLCRAGTDFLYVDAENLASDERPRCGIPFLFPICGRLQDRAYQWEGRTYPLDIHGFGHTSRWEVAAQSASAATLRLEDSAATRVAYPFRFRVELSYTLTPGRLCIRQSFANTGEGPMPFAYGFHPYFAVADVEGARVTAQAETQLDFARGPVPFGAGSVALSFPPGAPETGAAFAGAAAPAVLEDAAGGRRVTVDFDGSFSQLVLWAVRGKPFLCVEPWNGTANGFNTGAYETLAPGAQRTAEFAIHVELPGQCPRAPAQKGGTI